MLIVAVVFEFVPGGFDRIKAEVLDAIENSRKEPGAQIYDWAIDVTAPNRAIIFEVWDDQAALDAHFTIPIWIPSSRRSARPTSAAISPITRRISMT